MESVKRLVDDVHEAVGKVHATEVLTLWEGFGQFCRETLGVEPLTLVQAYGLEREEPATQVTAAYPQACPDVEEAAQLARQWAQSWARRFAPPRC